MAAIFAITHLPSDECVCMMQADSEGQALAAYLIAFKNTYKVEDVDIEQADGNARPTHTASTYL